MNSILAFVLMLVKAAGEKAPAVWPHVMSIAKSVNEILIILNDGKTLVMAGGDTVATLNQPAAELLSGLKSAGASEADAAQTVSALYAMDERLK